MNPRQTATIDRSNCPSVFDAGLPTINYEHAQHPDEAHAIIRQARQQAPIELGPHGPELLTYELVRSVLRDQRFRVPQGMFLAAQGITYGPVWDRVATNLISLDGVNTTGYADWYPRPSHREPPDACARRSSMSSPSSLTATPPTATATWSPTSPANTQSRSSARSSARRQRTGSCSLTGPTTSLRSSAGTQPKERRRSWLLG